MSVCLNAQRRVRLVPVTPEQCTRDLATRPARCAGRWAQQCLGALGLVTWRPVSDGGRSSPRCRQITGFQQRPVLSGPAKHTFLGPPLCAGPSSGAWVMGLDLRFEASIIQQRDTTRPLVTAPEVGPLWAHGRACSPVGLLANSWSDGRTC